MALFAFEQLFIDRATELKNVFSLNKNALALRGKNVCSHLDFLPLPAPLFESPPAGTSQGFQDQRLLDVALPVYYFDRVYR